MNRAVMAQDFNPLTLSSPRIFLIRMIVFVTLAALIAVVLYKQILTAFNQNPGLNTLIIMMLFFGIIFTFRHVLRLYPEIAWVNGLRSAAPVGHRPPVLLAPLRSIIGDRIGGRMSAPTVIPSQTVQAILDSVATRLDEARDVSRYMTGLLIFLGLLGTFWGLVETVTSVGRVIEGLKVGGDAGSVFDALKDGLAAPLGGMGVSFSSSLFGLAGSLILGFLDLQSGQAQNRFYTELQDLIATDLRDLVAPDRGAATAPVSGDLRVAIERLREAVVENGSAKTASAMANLAIAIDGLLSQMRSDQKIMREWINTQGEQQRDIHRLLETVVHENVRE
jgi:hypothetical protein